MNENNDTPIQDKGKLASIHNPDDTQVLGEDSTPWAEVNPTSPFPRFKAFLTKVEKSALPMAVTSAGSRIISQSERNKLRQEGLEALELDLKEAFEVSFDVVRTKDGLVIVAEGGDFTFSWELKSTIKSLDYDPFIEAENYVEAVEERNAKKEAAEKAKLAREEVIRAKREAKVAEIEAKKAARGEK